MKQLTFCALAMLLLLGACAKKPNEGVSVGNGAYLQMSADLSDAVSLTTNVVNKSSDEKRHLLKVSPDGKLSVVLSGEHSLYSYKITPNYIVASVKISENGNDCSLIAIPKVRGTTKVRCLNRAFVHCQPKYTETTTYGFDVRGDEVYFAYQRSSGPDENQYSMCQDGSASSLSGAISELRRWDGKSETVQTLFHSDPMPTDKVQPVVRDVFTSETNGNLCIYAVNSGLLCRDEKTSKWTPPPKFGMFANSPLIKQGKFLLGNSQRAAGEKSKFNLETFEVTDRQGPLPERVDFRASNGHIVGRYYDAVFCVTPDGESREVIKDVSIDGLPARLGKYAWYFAPKKLHRIELDTCEVDRKDYVNDTKLLSLTSLSWSMGDFLRVDGIADTGMPGSSIIDAGGRLISNEIKSIPIEHPITLTWK